MIRLQAGCLALVIAGVLPLTAAVRPIPSPPSMTVIDWADLLSEREQSAIANYHDRLLTEHDIDYRVVTARAAGDVNWASHEAFAALAVGSRSGSGRGLLLVVDRGADRVRLEVAAALEGVFTDAFAAYLEQRQMVPFFRENRVAEGVLATSELIFARAEEASAGQAFDPGSAPSFSIGGGASTAARIGAGADRRFAQAREEVAGQLTPEAAVAAYLAAMAARNGRPDLAVYSEKSRQMLGSWTMTPAQMDNVVRTYRSCGGGEVRYGARGDLAVIRYAPAAHQCAPWFLRREGGRWTLDLAAAGQVIRFNHRNQWRMPDPDDHAYAFGFPDWRFDRKGFPIGPR